VQIDDVDAVALAVEEALHLRVQRRVWCPKCTPAASSWFIVTTAIAYLQTVVVRDVAPKAP